MFYFIFYSLIKNGISYDDINVFEKFTPSLHFVQLFSFYFKFRI